MHNRCKNKKQEEYVKIENLTLMKKFYNKK